MEELNEQTVSSVAYTEENIRHLSDMEHVRTVRVCTSVAWVTVRRWKTEFMCC